MMSSLYYRITGKWIQTLLTLKHVCICTLLVFGSFYSEGRSVDQEDLFQLGIKEYQQKKYDSAIVHWEKVISLGNESTELYYNLGNAHFKKNDLAYAIWYYEKALKLKPGDDDLQFNLKVANARVLDKIDGLSEVFYVKWWNAARSLFSVDGWARMTLIGFALFLCLILLYLMLRSVTWRKFSFFGGLVFLLVFVGSFIMAQSKYSYQNKHKEAVIYEAAIVVKSAPDDDSPDLFVLHEGTKVVLLDDLNGWCKISIANGSVGWTPAGGLKSI